jgi:hypothetical protein
VGASTKVSVSASSEQYSMRVRLFLNFRFGFPITHSRNGERILEIFVTRF